MLKWWITIWQPHSLLDTRVAYGLLTTRNWDEPSRSPLFGGKSLVTVGIIPCMDGYEWIWTDTVWMDTHGYCQNDMYWLHMDDLLLLPQRNNGHLLIQYPTNHFLILVEFAGREDATSVAGTAVSRTATSSVDRNCYFLLFPFISGYMIYGCSMLFLDGRDNCP
jgi:hypothetical protein